MLKKCVSFSKSIGLVVTGIGASLFSHEAHAVDNPYVTRFAQVTSVESGKLQVQCTYVRAEPVPASEGNAPRCPTTPLSPEAIAQRFRRFRDAAVTGTPIPADMICPGDPALLSIQPLRRITLELTPGDGHALTPAWVTDERLGNLCPAHSSDRVAIDHAHVSGVAVMRTGDNYLMGRGASRISVATDPARNDCAGPHSPLRTFATTSTLPSLDFVCARWSQREASTTFGRQLVFNAPPTLANPSPGTGAGAPPNGAQPQVSTPPPARAPARTGASERISRFAEVTSSGDGSLQVQCTYVRTDPIGMDEARDPRCSQQGTSGLFGQIYSHVTHEAPMVCFDRRGNPAYLSLRPLRRITLRLAGNSGQAVNANWLTDQRLNALCPEHNPNAAMADQTLLSGVPIQRTGDTSLQDTPAARLSITLASSTNNCNRQDSPLHGLASTTSRPSLESTCRALKQRELRWSVQRCLLALNGAPIGGDAQDSPYQCAAISALATSSEIAAAIQSVYTCSSVLRHDSPYANIFDRATDRLWSGSGPDGSELGTGPDGNPVSAIGFAAHEHANCEANARECAGRPSEYSAINASFGDAADTVRTQLEAVSRACVSDVNQLAMDQFRQLHLEIPAAYTRVQTALGALDPSGAACPVPAPAPVAGVNRCNRDWTISFAQFQPAASASRSDIDHTCSQVGRWRRSYYDWAPSCPGAPRPETPPSFEQACAAGSAFREICAARQVACLCQRSKGGSLTEYGGKMPRGESCQTYLEALPQSGTPPTATAPAVIPGPPVASP